MPEEKNFEWLVSGFAAAAERETPSVLLPLLLVHLQRSRDRESGFAAAAAAAAACSPPSKDSPKKQRQR